MKSKMLIKLKDIIRDDRIYPRVNVSQKTIESYMESLISGVNFPSILVQDVFEINNDNERKEFTILLDGAHRKESRVLLNKWCDRNIKAPRDENTNDEDYDEYIEWLNDLRSDDIEVEQWKDEVLDINEWMQELRIESVKRNLAHGDRLTNSDKKEMCRVMAKDDDDIEITESEFAEIFGVTQKTINNWISDIRTRQKGSRDAFIIKLSKLGWSQQRIGDLIGIDRSVISKIVQNSNFSNLHIDFKSNKSVSDIAEYYGLDLLTTWAIILEGKSDIERFKLFGMDDTNKQPKMSDYWKFNQGDNRLGLDYPGRTWGNELMNIIYRFSKEGDFVLDPMAGGGVCNDVCLIMGRKCISYDKKPIRDDILEKNVFEGFEEKHKKVDLVFWDPPYYKKLENDYECEDDTQDKAVFLNWINKVSENISLLIKKEGYMAFLFSQYIDYDNELDSVLGKDYCNEIEKNDFKLVLEIQSPLSFNNQYQAHTIERAKKEDPWKILPVSRSWYIFKKVN